MMSFDKTLVLMSKIQLLEGMGSLLFTFEYVAFQKGINRKGTRPEPEYKEGCHKKPEGVLLHENGRIRKDHLNGIRMGHGISNHHINRQQKTAKREQRPINSSKPPSSSKVAIK